MIVNRSRNELVNIALSVIVALFLTGAKTQEKAADEKASSEEDARLALPVAKVNGSPITLGYLETSSARQSPVLRRELVDDKKREEFLDKLINMELLAAEAKQRGYNKHTEVASVSKNQLASLMHRRISESINEEKPGEEALRKYYNEHIDNYHKPEKVRARHILISDKTKAQKLIAEVLKKKMSQHEFRRLAQENSEDEPTRLRGGDLAFFTKTEKRKEGDSKIEPAVVNAAFKIKKNGEIYPELVKSDKGFHIVIRTGHRDKMDLSFEDAQDRLTILVRRETRKKSIENAINSLKDRFKVEASEENLKYVVIDLSVGPPEPDAKGGLTKQERAKRTKQVMRGKKPPAVLKKIGQPSGKPNK